MLKTITATIFFFILLAACEPKGVDHNAADVAFSETTADAITYAWVHNPSIGAGCYAFLRTVVGECGESEVAQAREHALAAETSLYNAIKSEGGWIQKELTQAIRPIGDDGRLYNQVHWLADMSFVGGRSIWSHDGSEWYKTVQYMRFGSVYGVADPRFGVEAAVRVHRHFCGLTPTLSDYAPNGSNSISDIWTNQIEIRLKAVSSGNDTRLREHLGALCPPSSGAETVVLGVNGQC